MACKDDAFASGMEIMVVANGFMVGPRRCAFGGSPSPDDVFVFLTAPELAKWIGAQYKAAHS